MASQLCEMMLFEGTFVPVNAKYIEKEVGK